MIQRVVFAAAVLVLVGCAYETELGSSSQASTVTEQCRVRGLGLLPGGDFFVGRVVGSASGEVRGAWLHIIPAEPCEPPEPEPCDRDRCDDDRCDDDRCDDDRCDDDRCDDDRCDDDRCDDDRCDDDRCDDDRCDRDDDIDEDVDEGVDEGGDDSWRRRRRGERDHCVERPEVVLLDPERVLCRINGVDIVDFDGPATVNGVSGYTYAINILDQADPGDPIRDYYTLTVYDAAGAVAEFREGEVVRGDVDVDIP